jgi:hypothetical protein
MGGRRNPAAFLLVLFANVLRDHRRMETPMAMRTLDATVADLDKWHKFPQPLDLVASVGQQIAALARATRAVTIDDQAFDDIHYCDPSRAISVLRWIFIEAASLTHSAFECTLRDISRHFVAKRPFQLPILQPQPILISAFIGNP